MACMNRMEISRNEGLLLSGIMWWNSCTVLWGHGIDLEQWGRFGFRSSVCDLPLMHVHDSIHFYNLLCPLHNLSRHTIL
eukprot:scaffold282155_cov15-Tisochrysis_lutea.AAC.1